MLQDLNKLFGKTIAAQDGHIGLLKDFLFDDKAWSIRYLVVDTGSWLKGRLVLLAPNSFGLLDHAAGILSVNLTKRAIEGSPSIDVHQPVSRQYEEEYYRYYGWPVYWNGGGMWGLAGYPMVEPTAKSEGDHELRFNRQGDSHLRSVRALVGYSMHAEDGPMGRLIGLEADDRTWTIHNFLVDAGHWYSEKEIRVPTERIGSISYEESSVYVMLTKAEIKTTPLEGTAGVSDATR